MVNINWKIPQIGSPKCDCRKPDQINNIILDNNDDQQHDISNHNTKIGGYTSGKFNQDELWYLYSDTMYANNEKVMEIHIKRWSYPDYNLTWHTNQHSTNDITTFNNTPNLYFLLQSFICLNKFGIFNLIVKFDLNSLIIDYNLYMYPIPKYFKPSFRIKIVKEIGVKLNINNKKIIDFIVICGNENSGTKILTFHNDNKVLSIMIHSMESAIPKIFKEIPISDYIIECQDKSNEIFGFENCQFDGTSLENQQIMFWITNGNQKVKNVNCDTTDVNNDRVMEINVKRWTIAIYQQSLLT